LHTRIDDVSVSVTKASDVARQALLDVAEEFEKQLGLLGPRLDRELSDKLYRELMIEVDKKNQILTDWATAQVDRMDDTTATHALKVIKAATTVDNMYTRCIAWTVPSPLHTAPRTFVWW
jgi:hypothetical protein